MYASVCTNSCCFTMVILYKIIYSKTQVLLYWQRLNHPLRWPWYRTSDKNPWAKHIERMYVVAERMVELHHNDAGLIEKNTFGQIIVHTQSCLMDTKPLYAYLNWYRCVSSLVRHLTIHTFVTKIGHLGENEVYQLPFGLFMDKYH